MTLVTVQTLIQCLEQSGNATLKTFHAKITEQGFFGKVTSLLFSTEPKSNAERVIGDPVDVKRQNVTVSPWLVKNGSSDNHNEKPV